MNIKFFK